MAITIKDLTIAYHQKPVIWDLDLHVPKGVLLAIVGPNGSGKTTLLKSIINLIHPAAGKIEIFGKSYATEYKKIAYVPQRTSIDWNFPISVLDTVLMGRYGHLHLCQRPTDSDVDKAVFALAQVNMLDFADKQISQLSGGQQQRVFLARALVQEAEIYLLDEPFVGVDILTEKTLIKIFKQLQKQQKTIVVVHHDLFTIKKYFDWVFFMNTKHIALGPVATTFTHENITKTFSCSSQQLPDGLSELV